MKLAERAFERVLHEIVGRARIGHQGARIPPQARYERNNLVAIHCRSRPEPKPSGMVARDRAELD